MARCEWALADARTRAYHDEEWGEPVHDDRLMFERLALECLQCGLNWETLVQKREIIRACFDDFDYEKIARYTESDLRRILATEGMLRSERKLRAVIENARRYRKIRDEYGTFCDFLWDYTEGKTILYDGHADGALPISNGLSERISKDLKAWGFQYLGPITVYSLLQACGIINDHAIDCPCYARINAANPTTRLRPDHETGTTRPRQAGPAANSLRG